MKTVLLIVAMLAVPAGLAAQSKGFREVRIVTGASQPDSVTGFATLSEDHKAELVWACDPRGHTVLIRFAQKEPAGSKDAGINASWEFSDHASESGNWERLGTTVELNPAQREEFTSAAKRGDHVQVYFFDSDMVRRPRIVFPLKYSAKTINALKCTIRRR